MRCLLRLIVFFLILDVHCFAADTENNGGLKGLVFSAAIQYYIPLQLSEPLKSSFPGPRLSAGYVFTAGGIGIFTAGETGFSCFTTIAPEGYGVTSDTVWLLPFTVKMCFMNRIAGSNFYVSPGYFVGAALISIGETSGLSLAAGARLYIEYRVKNLLFYAGAGPELLIERKGVFTLTQAEAGIKLYVPSNVS